MDKGAVEKTEISQRVQGRSAGLERDRDTTRISGTTEHDHEVKLDLEANDGMGKHEESHHEPIILVHPVTAKGDLDWATDEANPRNWSSRKKWLMASIVSLYALVSYVESSLWTVSLTHAELFFFRDSPLASSMMAPALTDIARDLHITSATVSALTLSIYVLATAIGPLFLG